ncbi:hypothetical protein HK098_006738 [Nowakowskiella sp. JEL0407]|nr:hypothetical protein HK098_006738 [Nowakowskiella sp. JEL0407]
MNDWDYSGNNYSSTSYDYGNNYSSSSYDFSSNSYSGTSYDYSSNNYSTPSYDYSNSSSTFNNNYDYSSNINTYTSPTIEITPIETYTAPTIEVYNPISIPVIEITPASYDTSQFNTFSDIDNQQTYSYDNNFSDYQNISSLAHSMVHGVVSPPMMPSSGFTTEYMTAQANYQSALSIAQSEKNRLESEKNREESSRREAAQLLFQKDQDERRREHEEYDRRHQEAYWQREEERRREKSWETQNQTDGSWRQYEYRQSETRSRDRDLASFSVGRSSSSGKVYSGNHTRSLSEPKAKVRTAKKPKTTNRTEPERSPSFLKKLFMKLKWKK